MMESHFLSLIQTWGVLEGPAWPLPAPRLTQGRKVWEVPRTELHGDAA